MTLRRSERGAWNGANDLPYACDPVAQVLTNGKGGMTMEEIGECLGITREAVRQILGPACERYVDGLVNEGWEPDEVAEHLAEMDRKVRD